MLDIEKLEHNSRWSIEKYKDNWSLSQGIPYEVSHFDGNVLLNCGINNAEKLLIGTTGGTAYGAGAYIGVGSVSTAATATQTDLQDETALWVGMESGFPTASAQKMSWKSSFGSGDANWHWQEFAVDCGSAAAGVAPLNRKVSDQGTKTSGQTWVLTLEITLS
jgi:hypothetical protein